jgi:hypothetical protein
VIRVNDDSHGQVGDRAPNRVRFVTDYDEDVIERGSEDPPHGVPQKRLAADRK